MPGAASMLLSPIPGLWGAPAQRRSSDRGPECWDRRASPSSRARTSAPAGPPTPAATACTRASTSAALTSSSCVAGASSSACSATGSGALVLGAQKPRSSVAAMSRRGPAELSRSQVRPPSAHRGARQGAVTRQCLSAGLRRHVDRKPRPRLPAHAAPPPRPRASRPEAGTGRGPGPTTPEGPLNQRGASMPAVLRMTIRDISVPFILSRSPAASRLLPLRCCRSSRMNV